MKTSIQKFLNKIISKDIFYVRLFRDKIEIRNVKTDKEVTYMITNSFSNDRLLIANYEVFEQQLKTALREIQEPIFKKRSSKMIFQPIEESVSHYSQVEKRVFRDSCEQAGATEHYLWPGAGKLSNETIMNGINSHFTNSEFEKM